MTQKTRPVLPPEVNRLAGELLNLFYALFRLVNIYELNNEVFEQPLQQFPKIQKQLFELEGKVEFRFIENDAFLNLTRVRLLPEIKNLVLSFIQECKGQGIGGFTLTDSFGGEEINKFLSVMQTYAHQSDKSLAELNDQLNQANVMSFSFLPYQEYSPGGERAERDQRFKNPSLIKTFAKLNYFTDLLTDLIPGRDPAAFLDTLRRTHRLLQQLVDALYKDPQEVLNLHLIMGQGSPAVSQAMRTALLSLSLGHYLGFKRSELSDLGMAALFHNRVSWSEKPEVLQKGWGPYLHVVGMATDGGFNPSIFRRILTGFHWQLSHDGSRGIPRLKKTIRPDLFTQIIALCAHYEKLTAWATEGSQGLGLTPHNALKWMYLSNATDFDASLLKMFINRLGVYPIGSLVKLDSGEVALVRKSAQPLENIHSPTVEIIRSATGEALQAGEVIDLTADKRKILRSVPAAGMDINLGYYLFAA